MIITIILSIIISSYLFCITIIIIVVDTSYLFLSQLILALLLTPFNFLKPISFVKIKRGIYLFEGTRMEKEYRSFFLLTPLSHLMALYLLNGLVLFQPYI